MPSVTIYSLHHSEHPLTTYLHCRWQEQKTQNWCHFQKPQVKVNAQLERNREASPTTWEQSITNAMFYWSCPLCDRWSVLIITLHGFFPYKLPLYLCYLLESSYVFLSLCPTTHGYIGLPSFPSPILSQGPVYLYDLILLPRAMYDIYLSLWFDLAVPMYDTHLGATHMTTHSIRGVQIPICLSQ